MIMIRDFSNMFQQMSGMPINSKGGKAMLKKYSIDTNSAQYKAAMKQMSQSAGGGVGYTNPQAIKRQRGISCRKTAWETEIQQDAQRFSRDIS